jgi:aspartate aminotransferase
MIEPSATGRLRDQAEELRRAGREVFDLTAGELPGPTPEHVVAAAARAASDPANHHYGPAAGEPALREAVSEWASRRYGTAVRAAQVAITNGAKQAIFNTLLALTQPGDEVIVPAPYWVTFPAAATLAGATPVIAPAAPRALLPGPEELESVRTSATRAVILASPHNPTGLTYPADTVRELAAWALRHELWLIADDTYAELAFQAAPSPARMLPEIGERLVTVASTSKSHVMTGWRTGWLIAPLAVVRDATAIQSHTTSNVSRVAQAAALAALRGPDIPAATRQRLIQARDRVLELLEPLSLSDPTPTGAFYHFPDLSGYYRDDVELAAELLEQAQVATVPGSAFGGPGHLRLSYAGDQAEVEGGVKRLVGHLLARRGN